MESLLDWGICVMYAFKIMLVAHGKLLADGIGAPLRWVYLFGPSISGYGFWEGKSAAEICSRVTDVKASFWEMDRNRGECLNLIETKVHAFTIGVVVVGIWTVIALWIAMRFASALKNKALTQTKA
jgi:hypothetical protein